MKVKTKFDLSQKVFYVIDGYIGKGTITRIDMTFSKQRELEYYTIDGTAVEVDSVFASKAAIMNHLDQIEEEE